MLYINGVSWCSHNIELNQDSITSCSHLQLIQFSPHNYMLGRTGSNFWILRKPWYFLLHITNDFENNIDRDIAMFALPELNSLIGSDLYDIQLSQNIFFLLQFVSLNRYNM